MNKLCRSIYKILDTNWKDDIQTNEFCAMWYGYETLRDCLYEMNYKNITIKDLKCSMKHLKEKNLVELKPIYNCDNKLCGRGWFSRVNQKEEIK